MLRISHASDFFFFFSLSQMCFRKALFIPLDSYTYSVRRFQLVNGKQVHPYLGFVRTYKWVLFGFLTLQKKKGPVLKQCRSFHSKKQTNKNKFGPLYGRWEREREREINGKGRQLLEPLCQPAVCCAQSLERGMKEYNREGRLKGRIF